MYRSRADRIFSLSGAGLALASLVAAIGIVAFLLAMSLPALREVSALRFLSDSSWYPQSSGEGTYGLWPMVIASVLVGILSVSIAVPLAVAIAIYWGFYASPVGRIILSRFIDILGAIPSVVFGLVGLTVIVPLVNQIHAPGTSLIAATLVLVPMILPTATFLYISALENISTDLLTSSAALGLSRFRLVFGIILPFLSRPIVSGGVLALARALGETMAVLMVAGNVIQLPSSLFDPVRTLTANIALEMGYALGVHRSALFFSGFMMGLLVISLIVIAEIIKHIRVARAA